MKRHTLYIIGILIGCAFSSCRKIEIVVPSEYELVSDGIHPEANPQGMYLVNEGNMGSNKCTLDYLDYVNGYYIRNLYSERNPNVVKELGDVGNDIQIYGSKLYVVVNCSHKVEVLDARTCERITQIDIPNCRYIRFYRGNAYVTSYVGPVQIDPNAPQGAVYRVDTTSLKIDAKVIVGYQPDELEILGEYIYVVNSGGYRAPNDSQIDLAEPVCDVQKRPAGAGTHGFMRLVVRRADNGDDCADQDTQKHGGQRDLERIAQTLHDIFPAILGDEAGDKVLCDLCNPCPKPFCHGRSAPSFL